MKSRGQRLGTDARVVPGPPLGVEPEECAEAPHVTVDEGAAIIEGGPQDGVPGLLDVEGPVVDQQGAGHARLDHQPAWAEHEHGVLGPAEEVLDGGARPVPGAGQGG